MEQQRLDKLKRERDQEASFQHTQLGVYLAGAFGLMYLWASSAQVCCAWCNVIQSCNWGSFTAQPSVSTAIGAPGWLARRLLTRTLAAAAGDRRQIPLQQALVLSLR